MARRFTPPTPRLSAKAQRERVEAARKQRSQSRGVAQAKRARKVQIQGDAFHRTHRHLERETGIDWRKARVKPKRYWDERWDFSATRARASWEDLHEWRFALMRDQVVVAYLESRTISVIVDVEDGASGRIMRLTAAAAGDFHRVMAELEEKFRAWAESYGRDEDEEGYSRVVEISILLRRRGVHPAWKSWVRGQVERREQNARKRKRRR